MVPNYLLDGALLGLFMVAACLGTAALEHPASPLRQRVANAFARRALMGLLMGGTAIALIHSPWGRASGALMNPAVVLAFFELGRIPALEALLYVAAQLAGGLLGVLLCAGALPRVLAHPAVDYACTKPGPRGRTAAFAVEVLITGALLAIVLRVSAEPATRAWTGWIAGALVALYILLAAPFSGMSMNPARTLASALPARRFTALWIYLTAPLLGASLATAVAPELLPAHTAPAARICPE